MYGSAKARVQMLLATLVVTLSMAKAISSEIQWKGAEEIPWKAVATLLLMENPSSNAFNAGLPHRSASHQRKMEPRMSASSRREILSKSAATLAAASLGLDKAFAAEPDLNGIFFKPDQSNSPITDINEMKDLFLQSAKRWKDMKEFVPDKKQWFGKENNYVGVVFEAETLSDFYNNKAHMKILAKGNGDAEKAYTEFWAADKNFRETIDVARYEGYSKKTKEDTVAKAVSQYDTLIAALEKYEQATGLTPGKSFGSQFEKFIDENAPDSLDAVEAEPIYQR